MIKSLRVFKKDVIRRSAVGMIMAAASSVAFGSTTFVASALPTPIGSLIVPEVNTIGPDIELSFSLDPNAAVYPPSADTGTCETTGGFPNCVYFSGTLTDNDTDGSLLALESIAIIYTEPTDADYFALDNTFSDFYQGTPSGPPGILEGDTDDNFAPNSYGPGLIFGVDIISPPPPGVYVETAEITACNLSNDPNCESGGPDPGEFTVDAQFTISVSPEPTSGLLILAGLPVLIGLDRYRRSRMAPRTPGAR
jgi:hypothetical protein